MKTLTDLKLNYEIWHIPICAQVFLPNLHLLTVLHLQA